MWIWGNLDFWQIDSAQKKEQMQTVWQVKDILDKEDEIYISRSSRKYTFNSNVLD